MVSDFVTWLTTEIDKRGWTNNEFARRAGVTSPTISLVISEKRGPGPDFCLGAAKALKIPPEQVYRRAGLLPKICASEDDEISTEIHDLVQRMPDDMRQHVLDYMRFLYQQRFK